MTDDELLRVATASEQLTEARYWQVACKIVGKDPES
jgi:hypothetical protein